MKSKLQITHALKRFVLRRIGLGTQAKIMLSPSTSQTQSVRKKQPRGGGVLTELTNAELDPVSGYIFLEDGKFLASSSAFTPEVSILRFPHLVKARSKVCSGPAVFLGNQVSYYHFLMEDLPVALMALREASEAGTNLTLLVPKPAPKYVDQVARVLEVPQKLVSTKITYAKLWAVSKPPALIPQRWAVRELQQWSGLLLQDTIQKQSGKRIYVSRVGESARRPVNEEDVETFLKGKNFEVLSLQKITFRKQMEIFRQAEIVVGSHGAGLANIVFASNLKHLVELKMDYQPDCFAQLAELTGSSHSSLASEARNPNEWIVFIKDLEKLLQQLDI